MKPPMALPNTHGTNDNVRALRSVRRSARAHIARIITDEIQQGKPVGFPKEAKMDAVRREAAAGQAESVELTHAFKSVSREPIMSVETLRRLEELVATLMAATPGTVQPCSSSNLCLWTRRVEMQWRALRPAPCALRPAPCALRPAPCAPRPAPRALRPPPRVPPDSRARPRSPGRCTRSTHVTLRRLSPSQYPQRAPLYQVARARGAALSAGGGREARREGGREAGRAEGRGPRCEPVRKPGSGLEAAHQAALATLAIERRRGEKACSKETV